MYKLCKTEQSARRQKLLEQELLKAMEQHDYEDISISELCEQIQVPRKSFYRYFSGKDGALYALIDHTLMEFEAFDRDNHNRSKRTLARDLERFFRFWQHNANLVTALEKSGLSGVLVQRAVDYTLGDMVFPNRFLASESREHQNHVVRFAVCGLLAMMLQWHQNGYDTSIRELVEVAERLLTRPLFPNVSKLL